MTHLESRIQRANTLIDVAVAAIDAEVGREPPRWHLSREQLLRIKDSLSQMREDLINNGAGRVLPGFGRVIADSWPIDCELGELILGAEQEYRAARMAMDAMH